MVCYGYKIVDFVFLAHMVPKGLSQQISHGVFSQNHQKKELLTLPYSMARAMLQDSLPYSMARVMLQDSSQY